MGKADQDARLVCELGNETAELIMEFVKNSRLFEGYSNRVFTIDQ